ncbi:sensor histidine kinase [Bacillus solitudinis]|uniref:sensor histidine kinase n=1 Tax=Bacillus solitudinis TaxID=2014074 RepID=UPI000C236BCA|nr:sensor histidine kinase [Bacillus solitudinis]
MGLFKRYRIRHIFFGSFFLFFIIFLTIIIMVTYRYSVDQMISTTTEFQKENLALLTEDLNRNLDYFDDISIVLSRQKVFQDALRVTDDPYTRRTYFSALSQDFSNYIYSVPGLHSIEVYMERPPNNVLNQPIQYYPLEVIEDKEWNEQIKNRTHAWIGKRIIPSQGIADIDVASLSRNVYSVRGELEAILILNIDSTLLEDWLIRTNYESNLLLLDSTGTVIANSNSVPLEDDFLAFVEESALNIQEQRSRMHQVEQKAEHIVVTTLIPSTNWTIMEITPYEELTAGSKVLTGVLALIGIGCILTAFLGTLYLTKKFTDPILDLTRVLKRFPQQDISTELPTDYRNEFGQLYNGYRELINRSNMLYQSLIEQHRRHREAELKALQANINPHFLYNTLDQLNWSALERGDEDMSRMLELLGNMLRIGLSKGENIISIYDELRYLEYYLKIQKIQMGERLSYKINAPESVSDYFIPKLTLQPFVENSIIHGFHDQREGNIIIEVLELDDTIEFKVIDNGSGLKSDKNVIKEKMDTGGYGTVNVQERLDLYFSNDASVSIENRKSGGAIATICIPKIRDKENIKYKDYKLEEYYPT